MAKGANNQSAAPRSSSSYQSAAEAFADADSAETISERDAIEAMAADTPGIDDDADKPQQTRAEETGEQDEEKAPSETEETLEEEEPLSDEDKATLRDKYGDEYVESIEKNPELQRRITQAVTAARQKDGERLRSLEEDSRIKAQYDDLFRQRPDVVTQLLQARETTARAPAQPAAQGAPKMPTREEMRGWTVDDFYGYLVEQGPQREAALRQQAVQDTLQALTPLISMSYEQYHARTLAELEARGYPGVSEFGDELREIAALDAQRPANRNRKDADIYEDALWSIPKARRRYSKARVEAEKTAETTRKTSATREASSGTQARRSKPDGGDILDYIGQLAEKRASGHNVDRDLAADPRWLKDMGL